MLIVSSTITIPETELSWQYARSGGPGGQNVNKVESKAILRWAMSSSPSVSEPIKARLRAVYRSHATIEGEFLVSSQRYRDQDRNRQDCLEKLTEMIRLAAIPPRPRKVTRPSKASKARRLAEKKHNSERKTQRRIREGE